MKFLNKKELKLEAQKILKAEERSTQYNKILDNVSESHKELCRRYECAELWSEISTFKLKLIQGGLK